MRSDLEMRISSVWLVLAWLLILPFQGAHSQDSKGNESGQADPLGQESIEAREPSGPVEPRVLTVDDYGVWRRIGSPLLSDDGKYYAYQLTPNEGDGTLFVKEKDGEFELEVVRGTGAEFSSDSQWVSHFTTSESKKKVDEKNDHANWHLLPLDGGEGFSVVGASSSAFSEDSRFVAIHKNRSSSGKEYKGADLILRSLETGTVRNIGNVSSFAFAKSGSFLAYVVDAVGRDGNGVYLQDLHGTSVIPLETSADTYSRLEWAESGSALAFLKGSIPEGFTHAQNALIAFTEIEENRMRVECVLPERKGIEDVISDEMSLQWHDSEKSLFFGVREQESKEEKAAPNKNDEDSEKANVDVWHWRDDRVQSVQARRAARQSRQGDSFVWHLDAKSAIRLTDEELPLIDSPERGRWAILRDDRPYRRQVSWGGARADHYRIDIQNGERSLITAALGRSMGRSPDGRWFLFLKGEQVWIHDLDKGTTSSLSKRLSVDFVDRDDDHPYELPSYGLAGFSKDGKFVVLNHRYDLWVCELEGEACQCLTQERGDKESIRFRYLRLDPEEETIDLSRPMLLSAYGEWTKKSGFYSVELGAEPRALVFEDVRFGRPIKAKNADVYLVSRETFEVSPEYYVSNGEFSSFDPLTDSNPQQADYLWGRRILVDYENSKGQKLQATLALPSGYEEGQRYPMLVYFYEKMSSRHHQYSFPTYDDRPHMSTYASDGYLVLMPDVVYETGRPGDSALDCVTSAVKRVIDLGIADSDHIALQGHSWGGYQSSFILTQTDMFCAVVTGAPVTNLVSFYNELYKSSGSVQQGITERGQVRMGTTPWENMELYHSQSPVHNVRHIETPFIILHGTDDGSVDWHQGLEFYNAARRHEKEVILLSYPGEGHHLAKKANQIDFQIRMKMFFDHYCKGGPQPSWMGEGVPHLDKDTATPYDGIETERVPLPHTTTPDPVGVKSKTGAMSPERSEKR